MNLRISQRMLQGDNGSYLTRDTTQLGLFSPEAYSP